LSKLFDRVLLPACLIVGKALGRMLNKFGTTTLRLIVLELLLILGFVLFLLFNIYKFPVSDSNPLKQLTLFFLFTVFTLIDSIAYREIKQESPKAISMISWMSGKAIWRSYIGNRFILIIQQLFSTYWLFIALVVSISFFTSFTWSDRNYYYLFLLLPFYTSIWVYFSFKIKKSIYNDYDVIFMRRLLVYLAIICYAIYESYSRFNDFLLDIPTTIDVNDLFLYVASFIFIAMDRMLKELVNDYERKRKELESKS
jgi:hypothetical protein